MTTPLDRVQRLREETAEATSGPWFAHATGGENDEFAIGDSEQVVVDSVVRGHNVVGPGYEGGGVWEEPDAAHIARWDPAAAALVLDLLARILPRQGSLSPADQADFAIALAVLDALDGGDA